MENRRKLTALSLLFLVGIIAAGSGASLLAVSAVNYSNSHGLAQYAEFWAVARSGGGLGTRNNSDLYVKYVPFSVDPGDLRVMDLSFNISASQPSSFIPMMDFIAALSAPNSPIFKTTWLDTLMHTLSDQATMELLYQGLATPHNITLYYLEEGLRISANNTVYAFTIVDNILGRDPNMRQTENSTLRGGFFYRGNWDLLYDSDGTFMYYVPDPNQTILHLGFNTGGNLSFSLLFNWSVSFEQEYGPGLSYAGNATIANWVLRKLDANTIGVSINLNNTNYRPPVPAFAVVPWSPLLETGVFVAGLIVSVVSFVPWRKYPDSLRLQRSRQVASPGSIEPGSQGELFPLH